MSISSRRMAAHSKSCSATSTLTAPRLKRPPPGIDAWLCIGDRKVLSQQAIPLPDGLNGYRLELSASLTKPDTTPAVYVFAVINNQSLVFRGFSQSFPTFFNDSLNSLRLLQF